MGASHRLGNAVAAARAVRRRRREQLDIVERAHDGPPPLAVLQAIEMSTAAQAWAAARLFDRMACRTVRALAAHRRHSRDPLRVPQLAALARDLLACRAGGLAAAQAARSSPAKARSINVTVSATP